ncbi:MAG: hypothetical protein LKF74_01870 [Megasphaera sp.]|jgi:Ni/Co efflux regulator RcnB|nr:hypothetical protein [Megasphaera sp.]MCH4217291.1 hypothetical protein [Megasphaera sp.]
MMKRMKNIIKMALVTALMLTSFTGAVAVQAAGPGPQQRWEQRNDRPDWHRDDHYDNHRDNHRDRYERNKKDSNSNNKVNWALGLAAVAAVVAISK